MEAAYWGNYRGKVMGSCQKWEMKKATLFLVQQNSRTSLLMEIVIVCTVVQETLGGIDGMRRHKLRRSVSSWHKLAEDTFKSFYDKYIENMLTIFHLS